MDETVYDTISCWVGLEWGWMDHDEIMHIHGLYVGDKIFQINRKFYEVILI